MSLSQVHKHFPVVLWHQLEAEFLEFEGKKGIKASLLLPGVALVSKVATCENLPLSCEEASLSQELRLGNDLDLAWRVPR